MKPLIYYDFNKTPDGKVAISKERLNQVLEEVYQAGVEDGRRENKSNSWTAYRDGNTYTVTTDVKGVNLTPQLNSSKTIAESITYR